MSYEQIMQEIVEKAIEKAIPQIVEAVAGKVSTGNMNPTMTLEEAGVILHQSMTKMYELVRRKDFPAMKVGTKWIVLSDKFYEWMEKQADGKEIC
ncbi:helix-turn-helix domain-containing protein [Bacillus sp. OTU530]|uniref:helix-turn-helix domain-containing protein n=1 Tax=Bacillus sp. OTU530 TaxID=3043862 RepID=UPI00313D58B3